MSSKSNSVERRLRRKVKELKDALRPFAEIEERVPNEPQRLRLSVREGCPDAASVFCYLNEHTLEGCRSHFTVGDFRRARRALR